MLFRQYALQEELAEAVSDALQGLGGWEWVPRANAATAAGPTDFGLVRVVDAALPGIRAILGGLAGVRGLHPNLRFSRSIQSVDPAVEGLGRGGGGVHTTS